MPKIECPYGKNLGQCTFKNRNGRVRDAQYAWPIECEKCSLVTHSELLDNLVNYETGSMHDWTPGHGDGKGPRLNLDLIRRYQSVAQLIADRPNTKILDFGCGEGLMIQKFNENFVAYGLEPELEARNTGIAKGLKIFSTIKEIAMQSLKFDIITLFHVIEHIYEPTQLMEDIRDLLNPKGFCVVETPNSMDALLTLYASEPFQNFTYWSHHPMLHSRKSLEALFNNRGFEVVESIGVQRYPIENHLYWLSKGEPGGHEIWKGKFTAELDNLYANQLVAMDISDTLWLVAKKQ